MGNGSFFLSSSGLLTLTTIMCMVQGYSAKRTEEKPCPTERVAAGKVFGGTDADFGRYPYAVSLQRVVDGDGEFLPEYHFCGGALIDKNLVLTAAHCVHPFASGAVTHPNIQIGGNVLGDDPDAEKHVGCKTILHEKYDVKNIANGYDIALLVLNTTSTKPPIEIVESTGRKAKGKVRAMGWGTDGKKKILDKLQEVDLRVVNNKECGEQIFPGILGSMMCAQGNSSDVCKGDSGGPLIKAGQGCGENDVLMGLTSFGFPCTNIVEGQGKSPGIFTRITDFADWIKNLGKNESVIYENQDCVQFIAAGPDATSDP